MLTELRGRPFSGPLPAPRGWRDGLGLLYDLGPGRSELETVLRYAVYAATADHPFPAAPGTEDRLLEWAHRIAADLVLPPYVRRTLVEEQQARVRARTAADTPVPDRDRDREPRAPARPADPRPFVLLEITQHAWEPSRYDWLVWAPLATGELTGVDAGVDAEGYDQPPPRLRAALQEAFRRCDEPGRPVMVQAALPYALLDLPLDEWHVADEAGARLGDQRPVVVRCAEPDPAAGDGPPQRTRRHARWEKVHAGPMAPDVLDCSSGHPRPLPDAAALAARTLRTVPVLCRGSGGPDAAHPSDPSDPSALYAVMASGYDVVLWRRGTVAHDPGCGAFHRGVEHTVAAAGRGGALPEALWRLRAEVGGGVPEAYWSSGLTLLYADPTRPLPGADDVLEAP
jgi:hypothetical protein